MQTTRISASSTAIVELAVAVPEVGLLCRLLQIGVGHKGRCLPMITMRPTSALDLKTELAPPIDDASYNRLKVCFAIVASNEPRLYGIIVVRKGLIYPT